MGRGAERDVGGGLASKRTSRRAPFDVLLAITQAEVQQNSV
jgi:hypothetical protein